MYERYQLLAEEVEAGNVRNDRRFVLEEHAPGYGENLRRLASAFSPPFTPELTSGALESCWILMFTQAI